METGIEFRWNFREWVCCLVFGVVQSGCRCSAEHKLNKILNIFNIKSWLHREGKWCLRSWELLHSWICFTFCGKERGRNCSFPSALRVRKALGDKVKWSANEKGSKWRFCFQQGAAGQTQLQGGKQNLKT